MSNRMLTLEFSVRVPRAERVKYALRIAEAELGREPRDIMAAIMEHTLTVPGIIWEQVRKDSVPGLLIPEMKFHAQARWEGDPTGKTYSVEDLCTFSADVKSETIDEQILSGIVATFGQRVFMYVMAGQPE